MDHKSGMQADLPQSSCGTRVMRDVQKVMWLMVGAICVLLLAALPLHAQTVLEPIPEKASSHSYGG